MANSGWLSTVMSYGADRAFPNLFDVRITKAVDTNPSIKEALASMRYRVESVDLDGVNIETDYSEAQKQTYQKNVERIKSVTLSIWETSTLSTLSTFYTWIQSYYSFTGQYFLTGNPTGTIVIKMDNQAKAQTDITYDDQDLGINLLECIPVKISYPRLAWNERNPYSVKVTFSVNDSQIVTPSVGVQQ